MDYNSDLFPFLTVMGYKLKKIYMWVNTARGLPAEYQEVEYIQSSGSQYIDTGFKPTGNSELEFDFNIYDSSSAYGLFGVDSGWTVNAFSVFRDRIFCYGNQYQSESLYFDIGTRYKLEFKNLTCYLNGSQRFTYTQQSFTSNYSAYLFAKRRNNSIEMYAKIKIYALKLWNSGTLERDFVPCYRKSDDEIGMYDLVNDVFYTNNGSGTFTKGADIPDMVEKQVRPSGWQPGSNTIAYYPLTSTTTVNDMSGNNYNFTGSATFGVDEGVDCYQCRSNSNMLKNDISLLYNKSNFTVNLWFFQKSQVNRTQLMFKTGDLSAHGKMFLYYIGGGHTLSASKYWDDKDTGYSVNAGQWLNLCATYDGSVWETYINGNLIYSWITSLSIPSSGNTSIGYTTYSSTTEYFNGNISELIVEDRAWTVGQCSNYYNQTKANYGL